MTNPYFARRILVIDDNPSIHEDFRKILCPPAQPSMALQESAARLFRREVPRPEETAYEVEVALSGQEGVLKVERAMESGRPFHVAFVDVRMPNGWNGLETTRRIWQLAPTLNIVLCTAFSDFSLDEIRSELRQKERFLILKKPFDNIEVQQLAESLSTRAELENRQRSESADEVLGASLAQMGQYVFEKSTGEWRCSRSLFLIFGIPSAMVRDFSTLTDQIEPADRQQFQAELDPARAKGGGFDLVCEAKRWSDDLPIRLRAIGAWEFDGQGQAVRLTGHFERLPEA